MHSLSKDEALEFVRERMHLFNDTGRTNPFACGAWLVHFIDQIAEARWTFTVPECRIGGESLMLLYRDESAPHRCSAATNYYASLFSPLISSIGFSDGRNAALERLVGKLVDSRPRIAVVDFSPLDKDCADTAALRRSFQRHGWYVKQYHCFGNWYLPCRNLTFDEYMKGRDSKLYNTWTRKAKKFMSTPGARLEIVTEPKDVQVAMRAFNHVYANSWKRAEPYPTFVSRWAEICAENGWLRLGVAWIGEVPVASQFWFSMNGITYIFKLAYDEKYAKWSAGTILSAHMFQHALDQDRSIEIDYLTGDDAYKETWMTHRRERVGLLACNPRTARGAVMSVLEYAGELRKRWRSRIRILARA